eukprot:g2632.t1
MGRQRPPMVSTKNGPPAELSTEWSVQQSASPRRNPTLNLNLLHQSSFTEGGMLTSGCGGTQSAGLLLKNPILNSAPGSPMHNPVSKYNMLESELDINKEQFLMITGSSSSAGAIQGCMDAGGRSGGASPSKQRFLSNLEVAARKGIPPENAPEVLCGQIRATLQKHAIFGSGDGTPSRLGGLMGSNMVMKKMSSRKPEKDNGKRPGSGSGAKGKSKKGGRNKSPTGSSTASYPTLLRTPSSPVDTKRATQKRDSFDLPPLVLNKLSPLPWKTPMSSSGNFLEKNRSQESLNEQRPAARRHKTRVQNALLNKRIVENRERKVEMLREQIQQWERVSVYKMTPVNQRMTGRASLLSPGAHFAAVKRTNIMDESPFIASLQESFLLDKMNASLKTNLVASLWSVVTILARSLDTLDHKNLETRKARGVEELTGKNTAMRVLLRKKRLQARAWGIFLQSLKDSETLAKFTHVQRPIALRARIMLRRRRVALMFKCLSIWIGGGKFMMAMRKFHGAMVLIQRFFRKCHVKLEKHRTETLDRWRELERAVLVREIEAMHGGVGGGGKKEKDHRGAPGGAGGDHKHGNKKQDEHHGQHRHGSAGSKDAHPPAAPNRRRSVTNSKERQGSKTGAGGPRKDHGNKDDHSKIDYSAYETLGSGTLPAPSIVWECPPWPIHHLPDDTELLDMIRRCRDGLPPLQLQVVVSKANEADPWADAGATASISNGQSPAARRVSSSATPSKAAFASPSKTRTPAAKSGTNGGAAGLPDLGARPAFLGATGGSAGGGSPAPGMHGGVGGAGAAGGAGGSGSFPHRSAAMAAGALGGSKSMPGLETPREAKLRGPMAHLIYNEHSLTRLKKVVDPDAVLPNAGLLAEMSRGGGSSAGVTEEILIPLLF